MSGGILYPSFLFDAQFRIRSLPCHVSAMHCDLVVIHRVEFYGNLAVVLAGVSALARIGYYVVYGKEGGALPLPKRKFD